MRSDFLFATPCALFGIARLLDIFGLFDSYNVSSTNEEADARALYADWKMTGRDLYEAVHYVKAEDTSDQYLLPLAR